MVYPKWLPRPKCWLRGFFLFLFNMPVWLVVLIFLRYYQIYGYLLFVGNESHIPYYLASGLLLTIALACLLFAVFYDFFWGKDDEPKMLKIFPPKSSLREGFFMVSTSLFANVATVLIMIPFVPETSSCLYYRRRYFTDCFDEVDLFWWIFIIVWITLSAYSYQWRVKKQNLNN